MKDCRRFESLIDCDRLLSPEENAFLQSHRDECFGCRMAQEAADEAFSCLRDNAVADTTGEFRFETRLLRRYRVQKAKDGVRYWMPAFAGAAAASFALFAALTLISRPHEVKPGGSPASEARRMPAPTLELSKVPNLAR